MPDDKFPNALSVTLRILTSNYALKNLWGFRYSSIPVQISAKNGHPKAVIEFKTGMLGTPQAIKQRLLELSDLLPDCHIFAYAPTHGNFGANNLSAMPKTFADMQKQRQQYLNSELKKLPVIVAACSLGAAHTIYSTVERHKKVDFIGAVFISGIVNGTQVPEDIFTRLIYREELVDYASQAKVPAQKKLQEFLSLKIPTIFGVSDDDDIIVPISQHPPGGQYQALHIPGGHFEFLNNPQAWAQLWQKFKSLA